MSKDARFRYGSRCAEGIRELIELSSPAELSLSLLRPGAWFTIAFDPAGADWPGFGAVRVFYPQREYTAHDVAPVRLPSAHSLAEKLPHESWMTIAARAVDCITAGAAEKIVLARKIRVTHDAFDPMERLARTAPVEAAAQPWLVDWADGQCWWGLSPELLLDWQAGQARSMALAGTRRRGITTEEDEALASELLQSDKDLREQGIVTRWIEERFCECGLGPTVGARNLHRLAGLQHLLSWVSAPATAGQALALLCALHPSPALLGSPRNAALDWLREHEKLERGLYGGVIGRMSETGLSAHVMIRGVLTSNQESQLFAGTGLVAGSSPLDEWLEGEAKLAAIHSLLTGGAEA